MSANDTFYVGDKAKLTWTLSPEEGSTPQLSELSLHVKLPDGTQFVAHGSDILNPSGTIYRVHFFCTVSGLHHYRWYWSGEAAEEGSFTVQPTAF